jgi:hypothetical protein
MKTKLFSVLFLCLPVILFAGPEEILSESFSFLNYTENELTNNGAAVISEIDLRRLGLNLTRHFLLEKDGKRYVFITNNGIITSVEIRDYYNDFSDNERFKNDIILARQLISGMNGRENTSVYSDFRILSFTAVLDRIIELSIAFNYDYPENRESWSGWMTVKVSR